MKKARWAFAAVFAAIGAMLLLLKLSPGLRVTAERQILGWTPASKKQQVLRWINADPAAIPILLEIILDHSINAPANKPAERLCAEAYEFIESRLGERASTLQDILDELALWTDQDKAARVCVLLLPIIDFGDAKGAPLQFTKSTSIRFARYLLRPSTLEFIPIGIFLRLKDFSIRASEVDESLAERIDQAPEDYRRQVSIDFAYARETGSKVGMSFGPQTQTALLRLFQRCSFDNLLHFGVLMRHTFPYDFDELLAEAVWRSSDRGLNSMSRHDWHNSISPSFYRCAPPRLEENSAQEEDEIEFAGDPMARESAQCPLLIGELGIAVREAGFEDVAGIQAESLWTEELRRLDSKYERLRLVAWTRLGAACVPFQWIEGDIEGALKNGSSRERRAAVFALGRSLGEESKKSQILASLLNSEDIELLRVVIHAIGRLQGGEAGSAAAPGEFDRWLFQRCRSALESGHTWVALDCIESLNLRIGRASSCSVERLGAELEAMIPWMDRFGEESLELFLPILWKSPSGAIREALRGQLRRPADWLIETDFFGLFEGTELTESDWHSLNLALSSLDQDILHEEFILGPKTEAVLCAALNSPSRMKAALERRDLGLTDKILFKVMESEDRQLRATALHKLVSIASSKNKNVRIDGNSVTKGPALEELESALANNPEFASRALISSEFFLLDLSPPRVVRLAKILGNRLRQGGSDWRQYLSSTAEGARELREALLQELKRDPGVRAERSALAMFLIEPSRASAERLLIAVEKRIAELQELEDVESNAAFFDGFVESWDLALSSEAGASLRQVVASRWLEGSSPAARPRTAIEVALITDIPGAWSLAARELLRIDEQDYNWNQAHSRLLRSFRWSGSQEPALFLALLRRFWEEGQIVQLTELGEVSSEVLHELRKLAIHPDENKVRRAEVIAALLCLEPGSSDSARWCDELYDLALRGDGPETLALAHFLSRCQPGSPILALAVQRLLVEEHFLPDLEKAARLTTSEIDNPRLELLRERALRLPEVFFERRD